MPKKRREGQTFLGLQVDERLASELDIMRRFKDRSQFLREAIAEKLERLGRTIPEEWIHPPQPGARLAEKPSTPTVPRKRRSNLDETSFLNGALLPLACRLSAGGRNAYRAAEPPVSHDESFSKEGLFKADAAKLKDTELVAHPDVPLIADHNVLWCGTLQLAWNEAIKLVGEKLHFVAQPPLVDLMNREDFKRDDLDAGSYVALADLNAITSRTRFAQHWRKHLVARLRPN